MKTHPLIASMIMVPALLAGVSARATETATNAMGIGNDYYVAQQDPGAGDENPGTEAKPFKSINGALKNLVLQPGDTLWIKDGEYREWVNLQPVAISRWKDAAVIPSGADYSRMITLAAFPGQRPVIKGSDAVTGWQPDEGNVWVRNDWAVNSQQLFCDGEILDQIGGYMGEGHIKSAWKWKHKGKGRGDMIPGSFYYDIEAKKLYAWLKDGSNPNQHLMEAAVRYSLVQVGELEFIRVTGLVLRHGNNQSSKFALNLQGRHCIVEDVDQAWHAYGGIHVGGEYLTVSRCTFNHNGNMGMNARRRGHRILDCETSYNNYRDWSSGWSAGGCKFIPYCHDMVVKGHVAHHNNGDGVWFDSWGSGVTIEGCHLYRNSGCGIHYEICSRGIIKNNVIYENGGRGIYLSSSPYCLITHNLCYRNGMSGIVSIGGKRKGSLFGEGPENNMAGGYTKVWGNILVDNCWDAVRDLERFANWGNRPELILPHDAPLNAGCSSDYNIFYRTGDRDDENALRFARHWEMGYAIGLKQWQEKTGWDKHSIYAKPHFVNEAEYDFHPTADCPSLWFVRKPDMGIFYDFDDKMRPGWMAVRTAGPFGGDEALYDRLRDNPQTDRHQMLPLPEAPEVNQFFHKARGLVKALPRALGSKQVTPLAEGIELDGVPFVLPAKIGVVLTAARPQAVMKPNVIARKLFFLFTVLDARDAPIARCVMARGDGNTIEIEWRGDGQGGISATRDKNLATEVVWTGEGTYWNFEKKKYAQQAFTVYMTTWVNDNQWLPIEQCNFTLLDSEAQATFLAITGESLTK